MPDPSDNELLKDSYEALRDIYGALVEDWKMLRAAVVLKPEFQAALDRHRPLLDLLTKRRVAIAAYDKVRAEREPERSRLREALRPFAELHIPGEVGSNFPCQVLVLPNDVLRARAALSEQALEDAR